VRPTCELEVISERKAARFAASCSNVAIFSREVAVELECSTW
jgi:hypothetical protein